MAANPGRSRCPRPQRVWVGPQPSHTREEGLATVTTSPASSGAGEADRGRGGRGPGGDRGGGGLVGRVLRRGAAAAADGGRGAADSHRGVLRPAAAVRPGGGCMAGFSWQEGSLFKFVAPFFKKNEKGRHFFGGWVQCEVPKCFCSHCLAPQSQSAEPPSPLSPTPSLRVLKNHCIHLFDLSPQKKLATMEGSLMVFLNSLDIFVLRIPMSCSLPEV